MRETPTVLQDIDSFHQYARAIVTRGEGDFTIDDLYEQWRTERFSDEDLKAIQASLMDLEAGEKGMPFEEFMKEFAERHGLSRSS